MYRPSPGQSPEAKRNSGSVIVPLKGLFADGVWCCNCTPRLPAVHLQTKKEGKNKGRWFYTCQKKPQQARCNFFLWDQDAKPREADAVLHNSRSEATISYPQLRELPADTPRKPAPSPSHNLGHSPPGLRFDDDDLDDNWSMSSDEEAQIIKAVDEVSQLASSPRRRSLQPETPRKATKTVSFDSPAKQLNSPSTPQKSIRPSTPPSEKFLMPLPKTPSRKTDGAGMTGQLLSPVTTPTPGRFRDLSSGFGGADSTLAEEILNAVEKTGRLSDGVRDEVRSICNRHALRTQGISKGRDISRLALQTKDRKVAELESKIGVLEAEQEKDKQIIEELKEKLKEMGITTYELEP